MRVSEVDEQAAEQYVSVSCNGGVFQSNDDNAMVGRANKYNFFLLGAFTRGVRDSFYLTDVFGDQVAMY